MGRVWTPGGLVNGGMIDGGHTLVNAGIIRAHTAAAALQAPLAFWRMDAASGNETDTVASIVLTDTGTCGSTTGQIGNSRTFNGTSQYFTTPDSTTLSTGDIDFTWAFWCYPTNQFNVQPIISKWQLWSSHNELEYCFRQQASPLRVRFEVSANGIGSAVTTGIAMTLNTWQLVIGYHDSVNDLIGCSVNDANLTTTAHATGVRDSISPFDVGHAFENGDEYWVGRIDLLGFWKSVLSSAEQTALYNGGVGTEYYGGAWH